MAAQPVLIYCADGNRSFALAAVEAGWLYGARLPATVYQPVYFADQDWKSPNRHSYMAALAKHRPQMATVLDWERKDQFGEVMSWAEEASQYCHQVIVIPKVSGELHRIPEKIGAADIILGYSVPTSYGCAHIWPGELGQRPVHLLGGSPQVQMKLAGYLNVVSADGNMAHQQAHRCRTWRYKRTLKGHWVQLSELGDTRTEGANLQAFRLSLEEIKKAWKSWTGKVAGPGIRWWAGGFFQMQQNGGGREENFTETVQRGGSSAGGVWGLVGMGFVLLLRSLV